MLKISKKIVFLSFLLSGILMVKNNTLAIKGIDFLKSAASGYNPQTNEYSMALFVGNIIAAFLSLIGIIFLVYAIYAGYLWMTAGGEEKKIEQAQAYLRNGVIGMVIALASAGITKFVLDLAFKAL